MMLPILYKDPSYVVSGDAGADINGPWIRTTALSALLFHVYWAASGNSVCEIYCQGSNDESGGGPVLLGATKVGSSVVETNAAGASMVHVTANGNLPEFVRLFLDHTSGSGGTVQVKALGR